MHLDQVFIETFSTLSCASNIVLSPSLSNGLEPTSEIISGLTWMKSQEVLSKMQLA